MATTSIWSVKGWLGQVVIYAENPEKTKNPAYFEKQGMTTEQTQGLSDVIAYASQSRKTAQSNEHAEIMRQFVSGINCSPETARNEMMATKRASARRTELWPITVINLSPPEKLLPRVYAINGVLITSKIRGAVGLFAAE